LTPDESDYLDTLSLLVDAYESKHAAVDTSTLDPVTVLKHLMEQHDMTTSDLGRLIGSKGVASEILRGKRSLSKSHMLKLAARSPAPTWRCRTADAGSVPRRRYRSSSRRSPAHTLSPAARR